MEQSFLYVCMCVYACACVCVFYHECGGELLAAARHHVVQDDRVLRDIHLNVSYSDECTVLCLGLTGQAGVQALTLAYGHSHHRPAHTQTLMNQWLYSLTNTPSPPSCTHTNTHESMALLTN